MKNEHLINSYQKQIDNIQWHLDTNKSFLSASEINKYVVQINCLKEDIKDETNFQGFRTFGTRP